LSGVRISRLISSRNRSCWERVAVTQHQRLGFVDGHLGIDHKGRRHDLTRRARHVLDADSAARDDAERLARIDNGQKIAARRVQESVLHRRAGARRRDCVYAFKQAVERVHTATALLVRHIALLKFQTR
jgi:hypothetical protein